MKFSCVTEVMTSIGLLNI